MNLPPWKWHAPSKKHDVFVLEGPQGHLYNKINDGKTRVHKSIPVYSMQPSTFCYRRKGYHCKQIASQWSSISDTKNSKLNQIVL